MFSALTAPRLRLGLDVLMALAAWVALTTGLLLWLVLPSGSRGATIWSLSRHDWGDVHLYASLTVAVLVVLHVAVNWRWVCTVVSRMVSHAAAPSTRRRFVAATVCAVLLIAATAGILAAASAAHLPDVSHDGRNGQTEHGDRPGRGNGWGRGHGPVATFKIDDEAIGIAE